MTNEADLERRTMCPPAGDFRVAMYRAWRRRGHAAMDCLRVTYGPHGWSGVVPTMLPEPARSAMAADFGDVCHELLCRGCRDCVRDALWIDVCDQTWCVCVGCKTGPHTMLFAAWGGNPYGSLVPEDCLDLAADVLLAHGWRPCDGYEAAGVVFSRWEEPFPWVQTHHFRPHAMTLHITCDVGIGHDLRWWWTGRRGEA